MILKFRDVSTKELCLLEDLLKDPASTLRFEKVLGSVFSDEDYFTVVDESNQPIEFSLHASEKSEGHMRHRHFWEIPLLSAVKVTPLSMKSQDGIFRFVVEITVVEEVTVSFEPPGGSSADAWELSSLVPVGFVVIVEQCFQRFDVSAEDKLDKRVLGMLNRCQSFRQRKHL